VISSENGLFRISLPEYVCVQIKGTIVRTNIRNRHRMYEALQHGTVPVVMLHEVTALCPSLTQPCPIPSSCQTHYLDPSKASPCDWKLLIYATNLHQGLADLYHKLPVLIVKRPKGEYLRLGASYQLFVSLFRSARSASAHKEQGGDF
jgi:hypothetical protein